MRSRALQEAGSAAGALPRHAGRAFGRREDAFVAGQLHAGSSISSSLTAIAVPPLSRTAFSTRKSPSGFGTRRPLATVCAPS